VANFVKSVEYVEITLTSATQQSANLTKSQDIANCVPFSTFNTNSSVDDRIERRYAEVFFEAGPKVTADRNAGTTSTIIVGIFVVEFDVTGNISVQQGTWSMASVTSDDVAITDVIDTTKAFTVINYKHTSGTDDWNDAQIKVVFNTTTELGFDRVAGDGTVTGRYYIVVTSGTDFSVQHDQIAVGSTDETATAVISAVTLASSFLVNSYQCQHGVGSVRDGSFVVDISTTTAVRARRAFNDFGDTTADGAAADAATVETQVVSAGGSEFTAERAECNWADSLTKAVAVTEIDQTKAIVIAGGFQGTMSCNETASTDLDGNYGIMDFTSDTEVTGTRASNTAPDGTTMFEVVEWALTGVAANPKGPLGMPLAGPFGGPI